MKKTKTEQQKMLEFDIKASENMRRWAKEDRERQWHEDHPYEKGNPISLPNWYGARNTGFGDEDDD